MIEGCMFACRLEAGTKTRPCPPSYEVFISYLELSLRVLLCHHARVARNDVEICIELQNGVDRLSNDNRRSDSDIKDRGANGGLVPDLALAAFHPLETPRYPCSSPFNRLGR